MQEGIWEASYLLLRITPPYLEVENFETDCNDPDCRGNAWRTGGRACIDTACAKCYEHESVNDWNWC